MSTQPGAVGDAAEAAHTKRLRGVQELFQEHLAVAAAAGETLAERVAELADDICRALATGGKLLTFGNGGSAADAQHFAAELTGRFKAERAPLAAVALTTDTSALTAIANDYHYDEVFARQVTALCRPGDVCVGISTSGNAENVVRGLAAAREAGARTWALTGGTGGRLLGVADRALVVPSSTTARIQELHVTLIHVACALIDEWATTRGPRNGP